MEHGTQESTLFSHLGSLNDPRSSIGKLHPLPSIMFIAVCATICGADSWVGVVTWAKAKEEWLRERIDLSNGVPSHDTMGRVFSLLHPDAFQRLFVAWTTEIAKLTAGEVVAIDGKTLRKSFDKSAGTAAIHVVSAWATKASMVLGQAKTHAKSNEITAIPALIDVLDLKGCLVTIDAMGCQTAIAEKVVDAEADYLLAVKDNQPTLHRELQDLFVDARAGETGTTTQHQSFTVTEPKRRHGREEERTVWVSHDLSTITSAGRWCGLSCVAMVRSVRKMKEKTEVFHRYYICSSPASSPASILAATRDHWQVENLLHWSLDVAFLEDENRVRIGHAAENMSRLRHIAVNLLRNEKTAKVGMKIKRKRAGWDDEYLLRVLGDQT